MVLDAVGSLGAVGDAPSTASTMVRYVDLLKSRGVTAVLTAVSAGEAEDERRASTVSSLVDTWLVCRNVESNGERNRLLSVIKSRGMAHSNQVREFRLTDHGAELVDVYVGPHGVLLGAARVVQQAGEAAEAAARSAEVERRRRELGSRVAEIEAQMAALRLALETETADFERFVADERRQRAVALSERERVSRHRWADEPAGSSEPVVDVR